MHAHTFLSTLYICVLACKGQFKVSYIVIHLGFLFLNKISHQIWISLIELEWLNSKSRDLPTYHCSAGILCRLPHPGLGAKTQVLMFAEEAPYQSSISAVFHREFDMRKGKVSVWEMGHGRGLAIHCWLWKWEKAMSGKILTASRNWRSRGLTFLIKRMQARHPDSSPQKGILHLWPLL